MALTTSTTVANTIDSKKKTKKKKSSVVKTVKAVTPTPTSEQLGDLATAMVQRSSAGNKSSSYNKKKPKPPAPPVKSLRAKKATFVRTVGHHDEIYKDNKSKNNKPKPKRKFMKLPRSSASPSLLSSLSLSLSPSAALSTPPSSSSPPSSSINKPPLMSRYCGSCGDILSMKAYGYDEFDRDRRLRFHPEDEGVLSGVAGSGTSGTVAGVLQGRDAIRAAAESIQKRLMSSSTTTIAASSSSAKLVSSSSSRSKKKSKNNDKIEQQQQQQYKEQQYKEQQELLKGLSPWPEESVRMDGTILEGLLSLKKTPKDQVLCQCWNQPVVTTPQLKIKQDYDLAMVMTQFGGKYVPTTTKTTTKKKTTKAIKNKTKVVVKKAKNGAKKAKIGAKSSSSISSNSPAGTTTTTTTTVSTKTVIVKCPKTGKKIKKTVRVVKKLVLKKLKQKQQQSKRVIHKLPVGSAHFAAAVAAARAKDATIDTAAANAAATNATGTTATTAMMATMATISTTTATTTPIAPYKSRKKASSPLLSGDKENRSGTPDITKSSSSSSSSSKKRSRDNNSKNDDDDNNNNNADDDDDGSDDDDGNSYDGDDDDDDGSDDGSDNYGGESPGGSCSGGPGISLKKRRRNDEKADLEVREKLMNCPLENGPLYPSQRELLELTTIRKRNALQTFYKRFNELRQFIAIFGDGEFTISVLPIDAKKKHSFFLIVLFTNSLTLLQPLKLHYYLLLHSQRPTTIPRKPFARDLGQQDADGTEKVGYGQ